jgi:hypothetical protein
VGGKSGHHCAAPRPRLVDSSCGLTVRRLSLTETISCASNSNASPSRDLNSAGGAFGPMAPSLGKDVPVEKVQTGHAEDGAMDFSMFATTSSSAPAESCRERRTRIATLTHHPINRVGTHNPRSQKVKAAIVFATFIVAMQVASAQGAPSAEGQAVSPQGASSAERAVEARHEKVEAHSKARAAKRAAKAASAASK